MSVSSVTAFANTQGGTDSEGTTTYTNVYHVYTDDKDDGSDTARGSAAVALGLPDYNDYWEWGNDSNTNAIAKDRNAELSEIDETAPYYRKWTVTIGYTNDGQSRDPSGSGGGGSGSREGVQDPVDEPPRFSGSYVQTTRNTSLDKDDKLVTTSSEEVKVFSVPSGYDTLIMTINTDTINLPNRSFTVLKCNSTAMWGLVPRQVFLNQWTWDIKYRANSAYISHRLEFWLAKPSLLWNEKFLDEGTRELIDDTKKAGEGRYKPFSEEDLRERVLLDGMGKKLDKTLQPDGVTITAKMIDEADFLTLIPFIPNPIPGPFE